MCVFLSVDVYTPVQDPEFQMIVSYLTTVLGAEFRTSVSSDCSYLLSISPAIRKDRIGESKEEL